MTAAPADRIRTLLLRSDNLLKNGKNDRALAALEEAQAVAAEPGVESKLVELVARRIDGLRGLEGAS